MVGRWPKDIRAQVVTGHFPARGAFDGGTAFRRDFFGQSQPDPDVLLFDVQGTSQSGLAPNYVDGLLDSLIRSVHVSCLQ